MKSYYIWVGLAFFGCADNPAHPSGPDSATAPSGRADAAPTPAPQEITLTVDTGKNARPISPYIYGTNQGNLTKEAKGLTLTRVGGNRMTAYNWENNASNAGKDWQYSSDGYISDDPTPGLPMKKAAQDASDNGASIVMTVPMAGWVSADKKGSCPSKPTEAQIAERFFPILPAKGSAFAYPPDLTDGKVYADEFVAYLESQFPAAQTDPSRRIFYMLDNEPDLWSETHSEIHPDKVTYAELVQKSVDFATAIKAAAPKASVWGPVNYGWQGMVTLQDSPDANKRDFLEFYLDAMKAAEATAGKRLLDVLDVHWYPEAQGNKKRITEDGVSPAEVEARVQAPRSLWDADYTEESWITQWSTKGPINLLPRLKSKIDQHYPGTKLSITEYNYGAGGHISGAIAQADVLGIFGREGLYAANVWLVSTKNNFLFAAFAMYRNYDGAGATFGDTSVSAESSAFERATVYASVSAQSPGNVIAVAVNKTAAPQIATINLTHATNLTAADVYTLTSEVAAPTKSAPLTATGSNAFRYTLPPMSVSTLVFHP